MAKPRPKKDTLDDIAWVCYSVLRIVKILVISGKNGRVVIGGRVR